MNYHGKHALVLGLGESGLAMARMLAAGGASIRVADTRAAPPALAALQASLADVEFVSGPLTAQLLDGIDLLAVSPGLSPLRELAQIIPAAAAASLPLWGEMELFAQALAQLKLARGYQPKIIAITGTNGKTTVTSLVGLLCQRAGLRVRVAGNISPAVLDVLREELEQQAQQLEQQEVHQLPEVWVLELSSFQLHSSFSLQADAATVLNLSQDHLDWHGDMAHYASDKARIFGPGTRRILNRDDAAVMAMQQLAGQSPCALVTSFGSDAPVDAGCLGLQNQRGMVWLAVAEADLEADVVLKKRRKAALAPPSAPALPCLVQHLMPADALKIRGQHNALNALAALALCRAIGLPWAPLLHALREYHGEPHRVELVASINGVDYYDDSKGTNVGATAAALNGLGKSFGGASQKLVLIAGGEGKGQDFSPLIEPARTYCRAVLLIGRDAPKLAAALAPSGLELIACATLAEAVQRASALAHSGDAVLLSPACASFDMFLDYVDRARVFVDRVRDLALDLGQEI